MPYKITPTPRATCAIPPNGVQVVKALHCSSSSLRIRGPKIGIHAMNDRLFRCLEAQASTNTDIFEKDTARNGCAINDETAHRKATRVEVDRSGSEHDFRAFAQSVRARPLKDSSAPPVLRRGC